MNKTIKRIAEETGATHKQNLGVYQFYEDELDNFVKEVIREAAMLTLDYKNEQHYFGWLDFRDEMKKHFGVE